MGYFPFFIQEVVIINIKRVSRWPHSTQNMKSAFVPPFKHTLPYTTESSQHSRFLPIPDGNQTISWIWNSSGKVWAINFISPSGCWLIITVSADYYFPNCSSETRGSFHDNWNFQKKDWIKVFFVALRLTLYSLQQTRNSDPTSRQSRATARAINLKLSEQLWKFRFW